MIKGFPPFPVVGVNTRNLYREFEAENICDCSTYHVRVAANLVLRERLYIFCFITDTGKYNIPG